VHQRPAPASAPREGHVELVLGAGEAHVAQAALLLDAAGLLVGARQREEPVLEARQHDHRPLQSLGGVERHQRDAVHGTLDLVV